MASTRVRQVVTLKRAEGFSLLELMITISILMISLLIVIPSMQKLIQTNKLTTTANELQLALTFARMEAIKQNRNILFCHSSDGTRCSAASSVGWSGWLVRAQGASLGNEVGPVLRTGMLNASNLTISAGQALAAGSDAILISSTGQLRRISDRQPLTDWLQVCAKQSGMPENIRQLQFRSNGRLSMVKVNGGGTC